MNARTTATPRSGRGLTILLSLLLVSASGAVPAVALAAEPSASPTSASLQPTITSPQPTMPASAAMCASAADLRLIVDFMRDTDVEVDGWVPILVGAIAGLSEARDLLGLVGESYRPLVEDVVSSLQDLFSIADDLRGLETLGSQVAALGEAITAVGVSMDELSVALQVPCPGAE